MRLTARIKWTMVGASLLLIVVWFVTIKRGPSYALIGADGSGWAVQLARGTVRVFMIGADPPIPYEHDGWAILSFSLWDPLWIPRMASCNRKTWVTLPLWTVLVVTAGIGGRMMYRDHAWVRSLRPKRRRKWVFAAVLAVTTGAVLYSGRHGISFQHTSQNGRVSRSIIGSGAVLWHSEKLSGTFTMNQGVRNQNWSPPFVQDAPPTDWLEEDWEVEPRLLVPDSLLMGHYADVEGDGFLTYRADAFHIQLKPRFARGPGQIQIIAPFWIPCLLLNAWLGWLCFRARRRSEGCCFKCGYNLRGNLSGRCPECGFVIQDTRKGG